MPLKRNFLPCRCLEYCRGLKADSFVDNNQSIDSTHVIAQVCIQLYTVQIYMLILYQVERWLRLRRQSCLPSKLQKFQETGWRCLLYLSAFFYFSTKNQMYFSRVGGCSTYLPSSTESFVSGKSRGSTASTTAGTATRIIRCAVKKNQFLNRLQSRWSRMSGFTTWSNSLFMGLSQSGRILLWLQWSAIVIVDGLAGLALLTYFRKFYCCKFTGCLLSIVNII